MNTSKWLALALMAPLLVGCFGSDSETTSKKPSITKTATEAKKVSFSTDTLDMGIQAALESQDDTSVMWTALRAVGMRNVFNDDAQYTVFAPSNGAFVETLGDEFETLLLDRTTFKPTVQSHVLNFSLAPDDFSDTDVDTLASTKVALTAAGTVGGMPISKAYKVKNGYIYVVDGVIGKIKKK